MSPSKAAALATEVDTGRKSLLGYLKELPREEVDTAAKAVKLNRFAIKLHSFPGDISTAMLVKVTKELAA